ncbi:unnamed protein product [Adineta steineri]|uniref:G-protein coupled receptors family 1 profile domain-containing protein n=1 Tax=Adineta steineri TaxID=433720 RepID=A0A814W5K1_9BILA|nr:unnamed protein product [Adineta steineri]CAF1293002.1 unnamed protein product [Adineta steineri]
MSLLVNIAYYITIYIGIPLYICGIFGSILNICILFANRQNPCTFLLIYSSIVDFLVLNVGLLPRILSVGFSIDPTLTNLMWCKIRTYGLRITTLIAIYSVSLMSIERFFSSCRTVRWRQLSNISFVRWITFLVTFIIATEGLPFFILTQILRSSTSISCTPMYNLIFAKYASFFCIPVLFGTLPLGIMVIMIILTYFKLHGRVHLRKAQRSLTLAIFLRIFFALISLGPYTVYFVYSAIASITVPIKSGERIAVENFILAVISVFLYITYSSSFLISFYISTTYRKQLTNLFGQPTGRRNVVRPAQMVI